MPIVKTTPDHALATPEAIQFRIEHIRSSCGNSPAAANRIAALKSRLPSAVGGPVRDGFAAALLVAKGQLEWGDRRPAPQA